MDVILNAAYAIQLATVALDDASDETIHRFAILSSNRHLTVLGVDNDVMKRDDFTHNGLFLQR